jgi:MFS family permease
VLLVAAFIYQEARHPEPIIPLHLFRNRTFVIANLIVFIFGMGMFGALQYLGLFVQTALGASATASGIISTPQSFGMVTASVIGGQVIARTGRYRTQTILGCIVILAPMFFFTTLDVDVVRWHISAAMVFLGVGFGLSMPTMSLIVQNSVPYRYLGVASSSSQFFRQIGSVFGIAIFAVILTHYYQSSFDDRLPAEAQSTIAAAQADGTLPPGTLEKFDDPTRFLDPRAYGALRADFANLPGGAEVLEDATHAQRTSVAAAVRYIFWGATFVAILSLALSFLLRELPLRRDFKTAAPQPQAAPEGRSEPSPEAAKAPSTL